MPLRRSPPPVSAASASVTAVPNRRIATITTISEPPMKPYESDTASESYASGHVSVRQKRRRDDDDHRELKKLISDLSAKVECNFNDLRLQNEELKQSLQFMSDKYDATIKKLENLKEDQIRDRKIIEKLEEKLEILERKNRAANFEIRNVPVVLRDSKKFELKEDLKHIAKALSNSAEVDIMDSDIKDVYRVATNREINKPIMVELNSTLKKDQIIQGIKNFNRKKMSNEKLNTGHLNIPGPLKPIFISEALTSQAQKLFYTSRQFARENGYSYCWTSRGIVYLRRTEGESSVRVESESVLNRLLKKQ